MDLSICIVTPAMHQARGEEAYDRGLGINDHDMNPGAPAIKDWQAGWRWREQAARLAALLLLEASGG